MKKLIMIANLGRVRTLQYKPAGDDPQEKAHLVEGTGCVLEARSKPLREVVTDQAGRFRQSGQLDRQGGMSYGEEHHLMDELQNQALGQVAAAVGGIVAEAGYPAWQLVFPQEHLQRLVGMLPAEAAKVMTRAVPGDFTKMPVADLEKRFLNGG